jgi:hypothetical protein
MTEASTSSRRIAPSNHGRRRADSVDMADGFVPSAAGCSRRAENVWDIDGFVPSAGWG